MLYDKNGCSNEFPPCRCPRKDCNLTMTIDTTAPDHVKSTGNYRYKCKDDHLRWWSPTEIQSHAI